MVIIEVPIRRVTHRVNSAEEHLYSLDTGLWDMQEIVTDNEPQIIAQITNPLKEWALNNVGGSGDSAVLFRFVPVQEHQFALFMVGTHINPNLRLWAKPIIRHVALRMLPYLWGGFNELVVQMGVIKSERMLAAWQQRPESKAVPIVRLLWEDEYYGRSQPDIPRRYIAF